MDKVIADLRLRVIDHLAGIPFYSVNVSYYEHTHQNNKTSKCLSIVVCFSNPLKDDFKGDGVHSSLTEFNPDKCFQEFVKELQSFKSKHQIPHLQSA